MLDRGQGNHPQGCRIGRRMRGRRRRCRYEELSARERHCWRACQVSANPVTSYQNLKRIAKTAGIDAYFPRVAMTYRYLRDQWLEKKWRTSSTPFGFDMIESSGHANSRLESGEMPLFLELLKVTDVLVDIGANFGVFTLVARTRGIKCIAIEPEPANLAALLTNLQRNGFRDVEIFPVALSKEPSLLPLFGGGEGASLVSNWGGMASTYSRLVPVNTLDNLVSWRFAEARILIKVDVEGHEFAVLNGATRLLDRIPAPVWLLEHCFKENFSGSINPHYGELFDEFFRRGYRCITADAERRPVTETDVRRWLATGTRDFGYLNFAFSKVPI